MRGEMPTGIRAQESRVRNNANAGEVQAVGIPAGADRWISTYFAMRMPMACILQLLKAFVVYIEDFSAKSCGILCRKFAVHKLRAVIDPAAVMKECEEAYHGHGSLIPGGYCKTIGFHSPPMLWAVNRAAVALEVGDDHFPQGIKVDFTFQVHRQHKKTARQASQEYFVCSLSSKE